jgi:hypothetical protein
MGDTFGEFFSNPNDMKLEVGEKFDLFILFYFILFLFSSRKQGNTYVKNILLALNYI